MAAKLRILLDQLDQYLTPERVGRFLLHPRTRYVLAWSLAVGVTMASMVGAWLAFRAVDRADGNRGHTTVDFGGQWLMGRLLVRGQGRHLYHREPQRAVLRASYPREDETPPEQRRARDRDRHDAESLLKSFLGADDPDAAQTLSTFLLPLAAPDAIGVTLLLAEGRNQWTPDRLSHVATPRLSGPLYPPINALVMAPLGLLPPRPAYRVQQALCLALAFLAGWGVRVLSRGRIWWPVASAAILAFPGYAGAINLGQNAVLALVVLIWGWVLIARAQPGWGGAIWGLLAFKPVWAAAFFLVPLMTGRWRTCFTMLATGAGLALATLPIVGAQSWFDWLHVARAGAELYQVDENWIFLSRDLLSVPRRWLLDFTAAPQGRDRLAATLAGWGLLLGVLEITARLAVLHRQATRATTGPTAAFLLLGAWLCCFHFMYYDVLLAALPVLLLFTEPGRYLQPVAVVLVGLPFRARSAAPSPPAPLPRIEGEGSSLCVPNSLVLTLLAFMVIVEYVFPLLRVEVVVSVASQPVATLSTAIKGTPWHTLALLVLWAWCGWRSLYPDAFGAPLSEAA